jgi:hypothetical protein
MAEIAFKFYFKSFTFQLRQSEAQQHRTPFCRGTHSIPRRFLFFITPFFLKSIPIPMYLISIFHPVNLSTGGSSCGAKGILHLSVGYVAKLGRQVGPCGLVWRVPRFVNELEGHHQTLTSVRKHMVLWLLFNFRKSLVYVPKLCSFANAYPTTFEIVQITSRGWLCVV